MQQHESSPAFHMGENWRPNYAVLYRMNAQSTNWSMHSNATTFLIRSMAASKFFDRTKSRICWPYLCVVGNPADDDPSEAYY